MSGEGAAGFALVGMVAAVGLGAAEATTLVAARAMIAIGDRAARAQTADDRRRACIAEWEAAARRVILRNARLMVLAAVDDAPAGLPDPLCVGGRTVAEMDAWCGRADESLATAEHLRAARLTEAALARPAGPDGAADAAARQTEELWARYRSRVAGRGAASPAVRAKVAELLGRLTPDASAAERAGVLDAAAAVTAEQPPVDPAILLDGLRSRIQTANDAASVRRADALDAAVMMQALMDDGDSEIPGMRSVLREVAAGRRAFDPATRQQGEAAVARTRERLERAYVAASVAASFAELGYEVDQGFATVAGVPGTMRLRRTEWDEHAVQVVVRPDEVRAAVIRLRGREGDDARRADVDREQQWCRDLDVLYGQLDDAGIRVVQRYLVPPGERSLPVVVGKSVNAPPARQVPRERSR